MILKLHLGCWKWGLLCNTLLLSLNYKSKGRLCISYSIVWTSAKQGIIFQVSSLLCTLCPSTNCHDSQQPSLLSPPWSLWAGALQHTPRPCATPALTSTKWPSLAWCCRLCGALVWLGRECWLWRWWPHSLRAGYSSFLVSYYNCLYAWVWCFPFP